MESFNIKLSNGVKYLVKPVRLNETDLSYQLSVDGKLIGSITPFLEDAGLTWRSDDNIDLETLEEIGELIEDHEE